MKLSTLLALFFPVLCVGCSPSPKVQAQETAEIFEPVAPPPMLCVRHTEGFVGIAAIDQSVGPWVVPLTSRSERVVCAATWMDEVEFLVHGAGNENPLRIQAVTTRAKEGFEVVQDNRGLWQVGPALPWPTAMSELIPESMMATASESRLDAAQWDPLPWVRQDGIGQSQGKLVLPAPPPGHAWVLTPTERAWDDGSSRDLVTDRGAIPLPAGRRSVWLLDADTPLEITLGGLELDALRFCEVERIPHQSLQELAMQKVEGQSRRLPQDFEWVPFQGEGPAVPILSDRKPSADAPAWHDNAEMWRVRLPKLEDANATLTLIVSLSALAPPGQGQGPWIEASTPRADAAWFRDVTDAANVRFVHQEGPDLQLDIRPTMGPGAAFGDFDGDGWQDLYLVQGKTREGWSPQSNRLLRNTQDGRFEDVTSKAGVGHTGAGMGALFFDMDGDLDLDLYVANYGPDALFENQGEGVFRDVSQQAGLTESLWSASVSAADYDLDGDLDLYVTSYLDYDPAKMPPADELNRFHREDPIEMLPFAFPGQRNVLLRNESTPRGPKFVDVTAELGLLNESGLSMQAIWWDFDSDGDPDLYVANDVSPNALYLNKGDGTFEDIGFVSGLDDPRGGMGLDAGDVDGDGDEDVFLSNWQLEANALYRNQGSKRRAARTRRANFQDTTVAAGLGPSGVGVTSWGVVFFDADLDGSLDLFVANGYTSPDYASTGICVGQPNHFFQNVGLGRFQEASAVAGPALAVRRASRSAVPCDYDQDGDVDLLITANNGAVQLLRNDAPRNGSRYLRLRLTGADKNTFGIGARVQVTLSERQWTQTLRAGMGYLSGNPPELHFGLGQTKGPAKVQVHWQDGTTTEYSLPELDSGYQLGADGSLARLP